MWCCDTTGRLTPALHFCASLPGSRWIYMHGLPRWSSPCLLPVLPAGQATVAFLLTVRLSRHRHTRTMNGDASANGRSHMRSVVSRPRRDPILLLQRVSTVSCWGAHCAFNSVDPASGFLQSSSWNDSVLLSVCQTG